MPGAWAGICLIKKVRKYLIKRYFTNIKECLIQRSEIACKERSWCCVCRRGRTAAERNRKTSEVKEGLEAEGSTAFLGWLCVYETKIHLRERGGAIEK